MKDLPPESRLISSGFLGNYIMNCFPCQYLFLKGSWVDIDANHANKRFPLITPAAAIEIDHKPYFMGVGIRQIQYGDHRYYMHNVVAEDIETLNKNGGNSVKQIRAAQSVGDRTAENPHNIYYTERHRKMQA